MDIDLMQIYLTMDSVAIKTFNAIHHFPNSDLDDRMNIRL